MLNKMINPYPELWRMHQNMFAFLVIRGQLSNKHGNYEEFGHGGHRLIPMARLGTRRVQLEVFRIEC